MRIDKITIDYKTNRIGISSDLYSREFVYDITNDFSLEIMNKRSELVKLNSLFDSLLSSSYTVLEEFFVKNALELLKLQENMKSIQKKIKENVPQSFIKK